MRALSAFRAHGAVLLLVLCCHGAAAALECSNLSGCTACTQQQPQPSMPKLPTGYSINPLLLAPRPPTATLKTATTNLNNGASSASTDNSGASSMWGAALAALAGKGRRLLQASPVASAYLGMPTPANANIQGYASSMQAPQQLIPQLQLANNQGSTISGASLLSASQASFNSNGQRYVHAAGMSDVPSGQQQLLQQQQQQQFAGLPFAMAPPAATGASSMPMGVRPALPTVSKESLSILVTDPRNTTGPHPWDVLLFKTNQFNTSKPAYRLGGLGLMLMTDFNKSQPLTDWNVLLKEEPKQLPQSPEKWNVLQTLGSSSSSSGDKLSLTSSGSSSSSGTKPLFGLGSLISKNPLLSFGSSGKETTPRFSSLFKLPQLPHAAGASLDAFSVASVPATAAAAAAAGAQVAAASGVRLWCTACQPPAYFLSAYGYCACSPGYGRMFDSKAPYACVKCAAGQVSVVASLGAQQQQQQQQQQLGKPAEIRLLGPDNLAAAAAAAAAAAPVDKPVLAVCQACPKGSVPNEIQTTCVAA